MEKLNVNEARFAAPTDAARIQAAINAASPGDTVIIPRYNEQREKNEWRINKAIEMAEGIRLVLDNCYMVQETGCYENMFTNKPGAGNFSIEGEGNVLLSGGEPNYLLQTTAGRMGLPAISCNTMLRFREAHDFKVSGFTVEFPRWATITCAYCDNVEIKNIDFDAIPHLTNLFGIILEVGCHNINIDYLSGTTGVDTVMIRATEHSPLTETSDIYNINIKNVMVDPTFSPLIHIKANGGHKVHDINIDTAVDSSDFFDKRRPASVITIGASADIPKKPGAIGDISKITAKNMYSRAARAISLEGSFADSEFENLLTFGDNIFAIKTLKKGITLDNVLFNRVYYGKGSEPNNSASFISRQAAGSVAVNVDGVEGNFKIEKLVLENEEEN